MSKLKIEHGASKVNLVLLKTNIEESISQDVDLLAAWSDNERKYIVNELLRFALMQEEDFQKYKANQATDLAKSANSAKGPSFPAKAATETPSHSEPLSTIRPQK